VVLKTRLVLLPLCALGLLLTISCGGTVAKNVKGEPCSLSSLKIGDIDIDDDGYGARRLISGSLKNELEKYGARVTGNSIDAQVFGTLSNDGERSPDGGSTVMRALVIGIPDIHFTSREMLPYSGLPVGKTEAHVYAERTIGNLCQIIK